MQIRENITDLSELGSVWPFIDNLQVSSFTYKRIPTTTTTEYTSESLGFEVPPQEETYIPYPEGIQVMIEPSSLEISYPEAVVVDGNGTKYYRAELITAFLVQAIKELHKEFSTRISVLESKNK